MGFKSIGSFVYAIILIIYYGLQSGEQPAFVFEGFIIYCDSPIPTQRAFRGRFAFDRHDPVTDSKTIQKCTKNKTH